MKNRLLRMISTVLVIVLLINMLPMSVFAEAFRESITNSETVSQEPLSQERYIIDEIKENRTEYSKEFLLSNGLHLATVYANAVHYKTENGWEEIDNTLKASADGAYTNTEGVWDIRLPQQLSNTEGVTISKDGYTLSFYLNGELNTGELSTFSAGSKNFSVKQAKKVTANIQKTDWTKMQQSVEFEEMVPKKSKSRLSYTDVYENTNIIYDLDSNMLKESIVLERYNDTLQGYTYTLQVGTMIPVLEDDGQITLYDKDRKNIVMVMPAPYLVDNAQEYNYDIDVQLTGSASTYTLTYLLPTDWLAAKDRAWPVVLDPAVSPTLTTSNIRDRTVASQKTYAQNWGMNSIGFGTGVGISRFYLKYNALPSITSSDVIIGAYISMISTVDSTGKKIVVEAHKVNSTWESETITWTNKPGYNENIEDYTIVDNSAVHTWNITDIARDWYATSNKGIMFKAPSAVENSTTDNYKQFVSSDYTEQDEYQPILTICFRNNNGLESYWDYTTSSAGRAGTGYVNNFTGNMTFIRNDIGFGGNRMPVSISHIHNANDVITPSDSNNSNDSGGNSFGMGLGWRTNYNQLVYKWNVDSEYYVWEDDDGTDHYFKKDNGVYKDEDGLEMTLTDTGSGTEKYCITDKNGNCRYFDTYGRLSKMSNNQETKSSINITYYSTSRLITCITDGVGRRYLFMYDDGLLDRIEYTGSGSTVLSYVDYSYENKYSTYRLKTVTDKDGEVCTYNYSVKGLLWSAQDIDGYKLSYTYTTDMQSWQPYRTVSVSASDGSANGGSLTFSYAHNQTTITDHNNNVEILQFNDLGNLTCIQDDEGHATYAQYAKNDNNDTINKSNQMTRSSKLQNTVGNRLRDSSFESGHSWLSNSDSLSISRTTEAAYSGSYSLKLVSSTEDNVAAIGDSFSVAPGETYVFSAYVKTQDAYAIMAMQHGATYTTYTGDHLSPNQGWTRLQSTYTNTSNETITITPLLFLTSAGTAYVDGVQVEKASIPSRFNLIDNGDFRFSGSPAYRWNATGLTTSDGLTTISNSAVPQLDNSALKITGNPTGYKYLIQYVDSKGSAGDCYVLSGWAKGNSVPLGSIGGYEREFEIEVALNNYDGTTTYGTAKFNPDSDQWQYSAAAVVAEKSYHSMAVVIRYNFNANTAYFDGIQLYKENFGSSYTYDDDGNVISVENLQGQITEYEYDTNSNLTQVIQNDKAKMTYTYDSYHNVKTATSEEGLSYSFTYDAYGNNTKVSTTQNGVTMESSAQYTSDGNYLQSATDALGKTTTYSYNAQTGVLDWVQYPEDTEDTRTEYTYDSMYRLATAACETDTGNSLSAAYTYTDDLLTKIQTGSTTYNFTYGNFGLRTAVDVGTRNLAEYSYTDDGNNYLSALDYGNEDSVNYTYDSKGRLLTQTYEDGDTVSYTYDNDGALAKVYDSATGITTTYYYDLTGRQMKYTESGTGYSHTVGYEYDSLNNLTELVESINGTERTTAYTYDDDNRIATSTTGNITVEYDYDDFGRIETQTTKNGDTVILTESYTYKAPTSTTTSTQIATYTTAVPNGYSITYTYTYDDNGNITSISDGTNTTSYEYDSANQLLRENNQAGDYTYIWTYDDAGNILSKEHYEYCSSEQVDTYFEDSYTYTYGDSEWGDLLTAYCGTTITYDQIGNPLSDGEWTYTWEHGRELTSMSKGSTTWTYAYDANGMRTQRTNGTTTYKYYYNGSQLSRMTFGNTTLDFTYDANGIPLTVTRNGEVYYYVTNLQGDVVGILNDSGTLVADYVYDAWGNFQSNGSEDIDLYNPLTYRGYVYDRETGLYYLQSRYYNPEIGRFVNGDAYASTGQGLLGNNMFAYCLNNPVVYKDTAGYAVVTATITAASVAVGIEVLLPVAIVIVAVLIFTNPDVQRAISNAVECVTTTVSSWTDKLEETITNTLSISLTKTAQKQEKKYHVHHIVAQSDSRAVQSRWILTYLFDNGVNDSRNLISVEDRVHRRLHTNAYFLLVEHIIVDAFWSAQPYKQAQTESVEKALAWLKVFIGGLSGIS